MALLRITEVGILPVLRYSVIIMAIERKSLLSLFKANLGTYLEYNKIVKIRQLFHNDVNLPMLFVIFCSR